MFPGRISHCALWEEGGENGKLMFDPFCAACCCLLHTSCLWCFMWGSQENFWPSSLSAILITSCVCLNGWDEVFCDSNRDLLSSPVDFFHGDIKIYWWSPGISFAIFHLTGPNYFLREHVPIPLAYRWWCHHFSLQRVHSRKNGIKGNHGGFRCFLIFVLPLNISVKFWGIKRVVLVQSK